LRCVSASASADHWFFQDPATEGPELRGVAGGLAAVFCARAPGGEAPNQDAVGLVALGTRAAVLLVADGVGGTRAGQQASQLAVRSVVQALDGCEASDSGLRPAILDGIERANRAVLALGLGAATTLAVAEICEGSVRPYHVGDSTILVVGQRGRIKLQTVAHSPVGFAVEAGVIDEREAMHHEERHVVSNVLGSPDMRIEMGSARKLAPRDTVLLASDGLGDNLRVDEIVERVRRGPIERSALRLAQDAQRRMMQPAAGQPSKPDDLSFVLFRPTVG
jgi:serine/threonine protein phosphatase PrpC